MTSSLPQDVREVFERFVTCEYTTIDSRQQPITWPVNPYYRSGAATIDTTTGLGYPKKALDARHNPRVAMLFSDPTGSGIESGIRVLVQGTAEVDDRDLVANRERYWRESWEKLPGTRDMHPPRFMRGLFSWYYTRVYVKVRPERVFVWPEGDHGEEPTILDSHVEEVRSGHIEEPERAPAPVGGGAVAWDRRIEELGSRHPTAVLGWVAPDGFPVAVRVPARSDPGRRRIAIEADPAGLPFLEGRACLTAHAHRPDFRGQENFQVRGDLARENGDWVLVPHRMVGGFELPPGALARYRDNARKMIRFWRNARAYRARR
ncbi:MAG: pyridoxamine 5'-phosphate oxidase family protein [Solirubrobacterales bacterium]